MLPASPSRLRLNVFTIGPLIVIFAFAMLEKASAASAELLERGSIQILFEDAENAGIGCTLRAKVHSITNLHIKSIKVGYADAPKLSLSPKAEKLDRSPMNVHPDGSFHIHLDSNFDKCVDAVNNAKNRLKIIACDVDT
jgi:hypothetical protein